jgi:cbb3-type cytochrome oxidase subunit 3
MSKFGKFNDFMLVLGTMILFIMVFIGGVAWLMPTGG